MLEYFQNLAKVFERFFVGLNNIVQESLSIFSKEAKVRAAVKVKGRIFEGSYHVFAEQQARNYRLKGWMKVRDALQASAFIELEVEGPEPKIKAFLMDLRRGNRDSSVALVTVQYKTVGDPPFTGFQRLL